ncbi:MAG: response regulator transcription factor [Anaerolineae bacterium]
MACILVVDDDQDVAGTVERTLRRKDHEVVVAYSGAQALQLIQNQHPDLVVLDIMMPRMDGIEVCQHIRALPNVASVPILFLTAKGKIEDKIEGFEAGADDYLTKPFDLRELELRVKALLRRSLPTEAPKAPLEVGSLSLDPRTFELSVEDEVLLLTPVEFELFYYLMRHAGEVISTERLLQEVWEYPPGTGDPNLVRAHIRNIRAKIEPSPSNPIYIQTISRHGYTVSE